MSDTREQQSIIREYVAATAAAAAAGVRTPFDVQRQARAILVHLYFYDFLINYNVVIAVMP